jgi:succinate dehydrogenase cytochrome b556 subunit
VKSNRPVNLSLSTVLAVNIQSPVAIASILHRISGVVIFLLIPVLLYVLQQSLASEAAFAAVKTDILGGLVGGFLVFVALAGLIFHVGRRYQTPYSGFRHVAESLAGRSPVCHAGNSGGRHPHSVCVSLDGALMRYSATSFSRSGVADWLAQRVSAYVLAAYFVVIVGYLLCNPDLEYAQWKDFMSCNPPCRSFSLTGASGAGCPCVGGAVDGLYRLCDRASDGRQGNLHSYLPADRHGDLHFCLRGLGHPDPLGELIHGRRNQRDQYSYPDL